MKAILIPVTESFKYPRMRFYYVDDQDFTHHANLINHNGWVWKDVEKQLFTGERIELFCFKTNIFIRDRTKVWVCDTDYYKYSCKLGVIL